MQKKSKRLSLHRETILQLSAEAMAGVVGGTTDGGVVRRRADTVIEVTGMTCSDVPVVTTFC